METTSKILVAGASYMVGGAIVRSLKEGLKRICESYCKFHTIRP